MLVTAGGYWHGHEQCRILTVNGLTVQQKKEILKASAEAKKGINVSGPFEGDAAINYLKKLRK